MRVLLLCLSCLLASVNGLYEQLFQIDLEGLMKDKTQMKVFFDCLMNRTSCENFQIIKDTAPKLLLNKCKECTAEQKDIFDKTVHNLKQKYPKAYTELTQSRPLPNLRSGVDKQTEDLFNVDFTKLLTDKNHSKALIDCLVDRGSCEYYKYIKETVPKVLQNKCQRCTAKQKESYDWAIQLATKLYPKEMAQLTESLEKNKPSLTEGEKELLKMDFTSLSTDKKEMQAFIDCLIDRGPCEKFPAFKIAGPKLLLKNCEGCTPEQKEKLVKAMKEFADKYPKAYQELALKIYPRKLE